MTAVKYNQLGDVTIYVARMGEETTMRNKSSWKCDFCGRIWLLKDYAEHCPHVDTQRSHTSSRSYICLGRNFEGIPVWFFRTLKVRPPHQHQLAPDFHTESSGCGHFPSICTDRYCAERVPCGCLQSRLNRGVEPLYTFADARGIEL